MAFIPDDSFDQRFVDRISQIMWEFYEYLCRKRNHESRRSFGTVDDFISKYGYKRASKFNLLKELKTTNWISGEDGKYTLLVGNFSCVDLKADLRKAKREKSKKIDGQSKKIDSHIRNIPASLPADKLEEENVAKTNLSKQQKNTSTFSKTPNRQKSSEILKTRPDLSNEDFIIWLKDLPENKNITVQSLFEKMLKWCKVNSEQPSRLRLLKWIAKERDNVPIALDVAKQAQTKSQAEREAEREAERQRFKPKPLEVAL